MTDNDTNNWATTKIQDVRVELVDAELAVARGDRSGVAFLEGARNKLSRVIDRLVGERTPVHFADDDEHDARHDPPIGPWQ
jgi:hypothetical protein